ncbi:MAG: hypothetical protein FWE59_02975 [Oscillospiraceae bacterium]|nr:hypothetical protein [Oscillospiraceae bacterium]
MKRKTKRNSGASGAPEGAPATGATGANGATGATGADGTAGDKGLGAKFSSLSKGARVLIIAGVTVAALAVMGIPVFLIATGVLTVPTGGDVPPPSPQQTEAAASQAPATASPATTDPEATDPNAAETDANTSTPTTATPTTAAPTTAAPATDAPVTDAPATDGPMEETTAPTTTAPVVDNELLWAIANLPRSDAVDILWYRLHGYWTAADNQFVGFIMHDGLNSIEFGYFETEWDVIGELVGGKATGEYKATLPILVPAQEANELFDARDEMQVNVYIDVSDLPVDGKIKIKIEMQASGGWYQYIWGGNTLTEAYDSSH